MTQAESPGRTQQQFGERILEDLQTLQDIHAGLETNLPLDIWSIRSIASAIAVAARENWFESAARAAAALKDATESEMPSRIATLLEIIGDITDSADQIIGRRVVLVGDFVTSQTIEALFPEDLVVEWASFETARDAEQYIEHHAVSLIVTNVVLADIDGRQFLKRIRRNGRATRCPILVVAPCNTRLEIDLVDLGATEVLPFPVDLETLGKSIVNHLTQSHAGISDTVGSDGFVERNIFARRLEQATSELRVSDQPLWFGKLYLENLAGNIEGRESGTRSEIFRKTARLIHSEFGESASVGSWKQDEFVLLLGGDSGNNLNQRLERLVRTLCAQPYAVYSDSPFQVGYSCAMVHISPDDTLHEAVVRVNRLLADKRLRSESPVLWDDAAYRPPIRRLLLVVPENLVPDVIRTVLERDNFAIVHVTSLSEGIARLEEGLSFEVVVADADLRAPDGRSAIAVIRDSLGEHRPGIVAVIGGGDAAGLNTALAEGADDFIVKPFSALDFLGRIHLLLMTKDWTMDKTDNTHTLPAGTLVDALVRAIRSELLAGSAVEVSGLGRFEIAYHESALEENPDGQSFLQPPRNTISFAPEAGL